MTHFSCIGVFMGSVRISNLMLRRAGASLLLFASLVIVLGCYHFSRDNSPARVTSRHLVLLAETVIRYENRHGNAVLKYPSLEAFLEAAIEDQCVTLDEFEAVEVRQTYWGKLDYWGNSFRWAIVSDGAESFVRILSDGPDGLSQSGDHDDLYVEIPVSPSVSRFRLRKIDPDCRAELVDIPVSPR